MGELRGRGLRLMTVLLLAAVTLAVPAVGIADEPTASTAAPPGNGSSASAPSSVKPSSVSPTPTPTTAAPSRSPTTGTPGAPGRSPAAEPSSPAPTTSAPTTPTPTPSIGWQSTTVTGYIGTRITVTGQASAAPDGAEVVVQTQTSTGWSVVDRPALGTTGTFTIHPLLRAGTRTLRAQLLDASGSVVATSATLAARGVRAPTTVKLTVPGSAKDLSWSTVSLIWLTSDGRGVNGPVGLQFRQSGGSTWSRVTWIQARNGAGKARLQLRNSGSYRAVAAGKSNVVGATSAVRGFTLTSTRPAVVLPSGAPRPSVKLPAQSRWYRVAADPVIEGIGPKTWASMQGRTWHRGCPVGRSSLRSLTVSYWSYDGYVRRGRIILNASVVSRAAKVFTDMFNRRYPIRSMYPEDRFGWSAVLHGANDYASMAAGNTSGFNCRSVVGRPGVLSPHASGRAIDLNTWENPYASSAGWVPNSWWPSHTSPVAITYRSRSNPVVKIMAAHGFSWTYGVLDSQHFDG